MRGRAAGRRLHGKRRDAASTSRPNSPATRTKTGVRIVVPEATANQFGYQLLGSGDLEKAIEVFGANAEAYPRSANVYDSLGEALEREGRKAESLAAYARAVEIGVENQDPNLAIYRRNRDRVKGE